MQFIPLHVYTGYSFLKSGLSLGKLLGLNKKEGLSFSAISDFQSMSGFPDLCSLSSSISAKPVYGYDIEVEGNLYSLYVLSEEGYKNLMAIDLKSSEGEVSLSFLKEHQKGLAVVLSSENSRLHFLYLEHQSEIPNYLIGLNKGIERFYVGIPYLPNEMLFVNYLRDFLSSHPYDFLAFPHVRYARKEDAIALEIVEAIAKNETLDHKSKSGDNFYLTQEEAKAFYKEEEINGSYRLAELASSFVFLQKRGGLLKFPCPDGSTSEEYLRRLALEGLSKKNPGAGKEYLDRLDYELSVINKMGYADYFLIVSDYVHYALDHGISVGPGRGSGAGSLVSYCLDIVTPDPLKYDLLFERFLNPERQSMPDIDVDFADIRRDEIATYLQKKYGKERVSHIVTMQTFGAKAALRDIGRVFEYEPREIDLIAKLIIDNTTFAWNYRNNGKFRQLLDSDKYYLQIVSLSAKVEGLPRQPGIHAAGVLLNDAPLQTAVPVHNDPSWGYIAEYEMNHLEEQGFLKMDLLGLRNLTIVDRCLALIKRDTGKDIYYRTIPYEEKEPIGLICSGKTMGLFQLESPGMNRAIREVQPSSFEDIVAILALFRPGPMKYISTFAARKKGLEKVSYPCKELEPILKSTYGIIVYQEQIMAIVRVMAGFSYGQADLFRRAISKKNAEKLASLEKDFVSGCLKNGHSEAIAKQVYSLIYRFAEYGFNKSHALSYAVITCQMAWLKYHYPLEFYCATMDNTSSGDSKFSSLVSEIKRSGYCFSLPDVNRSGLLFLPLDGKINFPLLSIKGIGSAFVKDLIDERSHKPFIDIFDFALRMKRFRLSLATLVKLVDAGAFDSINPNRESLRLGASDAMTYAEMLGGESGQEVLLGLNFPKPALKDIKGSRMDDLLAEKDTVGMMVSGSPLFAKEDVIAKNGYMSLSELLEKGYGKAAAIIASVHAIATKSGKKMAFITLYDDTSEQDFVMFADSYSRDYPSLKEGNLVVVDAKKDNRREDSYIASSISLL